MTNPSTPDPRATPPATGGASAGRPEDYSSERAAPGSEQFAAGTSAGARPSSASPSYDDAASSGGQTTSTGSSGSSTARTAKDEAGQVKDTAVDAGKDVAGTAKEQAGNVAGEAKQQARGLFDTVTNELSEQGKKQQERAAGTVDAMSKELHSMAANSEESGPLTDLAHQASQKAGELAHWLDNKEPRDVVEEVRRYARRRPVAFLALCGLAGVVAGRLTRGAVAANTKLDSPDSDSDRFTTPTRAIESSPGTSTVPRTPSVTAYEGDDRTDFPR